MSHNNVGNNVVIRDFNNMVNECGVIHWKTGAGKSDIGGYLTKDYVDDLGKDYVDDLTKDLAKDLGISYISILENLLVRALPIVESEKDLYSDVNKLYEEMKEIVDSVVDNDINN